MLQNNHRTRTFGQRIGFVPRPGNAPATRQMPRKAVFIRAALSSPAVFDPIPCTVTTISAAGASVRLPSELAGPHFRLPTMITLRLLNDRAEVDCRIIHKTAGVLGVQFRSPFREIAGA